MGVNLRDKFLVGDYSKKLLKGISFLGLFLLFIANGYGQDPPSGYTVTIDQDPINAGNQTAVSFTFTGAEVGATYNYSFTSSGGGGTVGASGTVASAGQTISPINLSTLPDGTITLSVTLTNGNGTGSAATDTSTKDTAAPSGYSVVINQDPINAGNQTAVRFHIYGSGSRRYL